MLRIVGKFSFCKRLAYSKVYVKTKRDEVELQNTVFITTVESFHELLFGYFEIIFYSHFGPFEFKTAFAKIFFRDLVSKRKDYCFKIVDSKFMKRFEDFSLNQIEPKACGVFRYKKYESNNLRIKEAYKSPDFAQNCLDLCIRYKLFENDKITPDKSEISRTIALSKYLFFYDKIFDVWDSFSDLRKGSLRCHLLFWSGLIVLFQRQKSDDFPRFSHNTPLRNITAPLSSHKNFNKNHKNCESTQIQVLENIQNEVVRREFACNESSVIKNLPKSNIELDTQVSRILISSLPQKTVHKNSKSNLLKLDDFFESKINLIGSSDISSKFSELKPEIFDNKNIKPSPIYINNQNEQIYKKQKRDFFRYFHHKFLFAISPYNNYFILRDLKRYSVDSNIREENRLIMEITNFKEHDILRVDFNDKNNQTPHTIILDPINNVLVVSLRGTQSHHDALKDLDYKYIRFLDGYGHSGIIKSAQTFVDNHQHTLLQLFTKHKAKSILFTGHSLGGAIAACIHILISKIEKFKNLKTSAVTYGAPPFLSSNLCMKNIYKITNIIYGSDLIPSLSFGTVMDLKYKCISLAKLVGKDKNDADLIATIEKYLRDSHLFPKLFIPGKIIHLKKRKFYNKDKKLKDEIMIIKQDFNFYNKIYITRNFLKHHQLHSYLSILENS